MVLLYHLLVHGVILGCLSVFVLLCCFMSCLLRCLLFDVFYGLYSRGVSVFTDVASCLSFFYGFLLFAVHLFFARLFSCLLILLGSPRVYMVIFILIYVLPRINVSLFCVRLLCMCACA